MIPLTVTAHLSSPVLGLDRQPMMLDAPLSWAYAARAHGRGDRIPPITDTFAVDFPLPLDRSDVGPDWVWCTSAGVLDVVAWTAVQVRRKPATDAMARYAKDRKHHVGLGPYKARDTTLGAILARSIVWHVNATDRAELEALLVLVTDLGARHRNSFGHVDRWTIEDGHDPDAWRARPMPPEHPARAPYWHRGRRC